MYDRDMPRLRKHALASPEGLTDVTLFALLTIQQPLQQCKASFEDVKLRGLHSRYLFGAKRPGLAYAQEHAAVLHAAVKRAVKVRDTVGAIDVLTNVPGLGMVKAAFVAQICGLDVACIDRHNLSRLGLHEAYFKLPKTLNRAKKLEKIEAYVLTTRQTGGARWWWNTWCQFVAGRRGSPLKTADAVSAFHCEAIGL